MGYLLREDCKTNLQGQSQVFQFICLALSLFTQTCQELHHFLWRIISFLLKEISIHLLLTRAREHCFPLKKYWRFFEKDAKNHIIEERKYKYLSSSEVSITKKRFKKEFMEEFWEQIKAQIPWMRYHLDE